MDVITAITKHLETWRPLKEGDALFAAVSGGADSLCLLHALSLLREGTARTPSFALFCIHVHHGIRGEAADADAAFVEESCRKLAVPFLLRKVDVPAYVLAHPHIGTEEAARLLRYRALAEAAHAARAEEAVPVIATAHQTEDQAETVLLHLFRGTGIAGLKGMLPVKLLTESRMRLKLIRPLLECTRGEILAYLRQQGLSFRTDETNEEEAQTRNRVRKSILRYAEAEINAQAAVHIAQTAGDMRLVFSFAERMAGEAFARIRVDGAALFQNGEEPPVSLREAVCLSVPLLREADPFLREQVLRLSFSRARGEERDGAKGLARAHIRALAELVTKDRGRASCDLPDGMRAYRLHDRLYITRPIVV